MSMEVVAPDTLFSSYKYWLVFTNYSYARIHPLCSWLVWAIVLPKDTDEHTLSRLRLSAYIYTVIIYIDRFLFLVLSNCYKLDQWREIIEWMLVCWKDCACLRCSCIRPWCGNALLRHVYLEFQQVWNNFCRLVRFQNLYQCLFVLLSACAGSISFVF